MIGRENPRDPKGEQPRHAAFVRAHAHATSSTAGRAGQPPGWPGSLGTGSHPRCQARHPSRENERRAFNLPKEVVMAFAIAIGLRRDAGQVAHQLHRIEVVAPGLSHLEVAHG